jgi:hypothetical protein
MPPQTWRVDTLAVLIGTQRGSLLSSELGNSEMVLTSRTWLVEDSVLIESIVYTMSFRNETSSLVDFL